MATAARSVWKGFIQFSLVSVPVRAYSAMIWVFSSLVSVVMVSR